MHYYQFNIGDYRKDTIHLSRIEHSIYRDLIDWYYLEENPIPKETQVVIRRLRLGCESDILMLSNVLSDFFSLTDDGYRHGRIDADIAEYHIQCDKNRNNGIKGGRPKVKKTQSVTSGLPVAPQTDATANPNHKPLTTNHEPLTNSVSKDTGDKSPLTSDEIIFGYGVPLLTGAGIAEKQARSFLGGLRKQNGDAAVVNTLRECLKAKPLQPLEWLAAVLPPSGQSTKQKKSYSEQQRDRIAEFTGKSILEISDVIAITSN